jgi:hypothetical protein
MVSNEVAVLGRCNALAMSLAQGMADVRGFGRLLQGGEEPTDG